MDFLRGKSILVTGLTGSFGKAFTRTLLDQSLSVRLVGMSRNATMRYELERAFPADSRLRVLPGDVRQFGDLEAVFRAAGPFDYIIHAAAEKHVTTGEAFRGYTWGVNSCGATNVIAFAQCYGGKVLALSTDKATLDRDGHEPANEYGKSKRAAEEAFVAASYSCVRYGNVVSSAGSVVPAFIEQRRNGVLTLTDARMTRFAMPIDDTGSNGCSVQWAPAGGLPRRVWSAVGLVLYALEHMRGREIFVPRIPSHSVGDLAATVGPGCRIEEVGIRPGERLAEVLISPSESDRTWALPNGLYVILSEAGMDCPGAVRVPPGFAYSSDDDPLPVQWVEQV